MIRALVFDCFGVLTSDGWLPFKRKYFGDNPSLFEEAGRLNALSDGGKIDYRQFLAMIARLADMPVEQARYQIERNVNDELLFEYIKQKLKPQYRLGMLSNASVNWLDTLFTPEQNALFDAVSLSCDTGFVKPQKEAYESIAKRLGCQLDECLLIDDQERYIAGAKQIGMPALLYRGLDELQRDLPLVVSNMNA